MGISKRLSWLDVGKGIAMIFVMLSHTIWLPDIYGQFFRPIYLSFFFIASGYVYSIKSGFRELFIRKSRTLLIPLFSLGLINMLSSQIISTGEHSLKEDFLGMIFQIRGKNDYMWFIACLYLAEIVFYFILKYIHPKLHLIIGFTGFLISYFMAAYKIGPLPWHLQTIGTALFFLIIGYELKTHENVLIKYYNRNILITSLCIYAAIMFIKLIIFNDWNTVKVNNYSSGILLWLSVSLSANFFFIQLIRWINTCKCLEFIGKNTLVYFAFQFKFQRIFEIVAKKISLINLPLAPWYISFISVAFESICLAGCSLLINRYFPFLLGKNKRMV